MLKNKLLNYIIIIYITKVKEVIYLYVYFI